MSAQGLQIERAADRRLLYFDIATDIARTRSTESLQRACLAATRSLNYDFYLFGGYYPIVESIVMSSSFPVAWRQRYDSNNYIAIDPVVRHCWSESTAIEWRNVVYSEGKHGELERMVMHEASEFGLRSGISIPLHGAGAEGCMLSLASQEPQADNDKYDEAGLQIIVHAMHDATKRIIAKSAAVTAPNIDNLSPREIECLSWTAKGKTSWAISRILDVSENTVIFHLRNAIKKLEVTNRSHAVAKAIALSKITPF
jgi:DNA-binding CsgD family transcriptional regulator